MNQPFLVILVILMILLMTATAVLAVIFAAKKKSLVNDSIRNLSLLLLCYFLFVFLQYYFQHNTSAVVLMKFTGVLGDICYFWFIACWIYVLRNFSQNNTLLHTKTLFLATAIYGVLTELIVVFAATYPSPHFDFTIVSPLWKYCLLFVNAAYDLWILCLASRFLFLCLKTQTDKIHRTLSMIFGIPFIPYMLWILFWDFNNVFGLENGLIDFIIVDPLLIIYCIFGATTIYFFFQKDPLALFSQQEQAVCVEQLPLFISTCGLTKREGEVLELVCSGLNNPDIGEVLCISEHTVKRHMNNIFHKTEVANRYELISKVLTK